MSTASVFTGIASCAHRALIRSRGANAPPACASARIVVRREGDKPPPGFCELVPAVPSPPPCHLHRNSRSRSHPAHFASTAPPTSPHLSRAKCAGVFPPLRHSCSPSQKGEWSDECLAKRTSAFLPLDGVDLLFDEPHPGGKDNLPPSVIYIVHQHTILILAYQDSPLEEIKGGGSAEGRKTQIFATYTQRMLRRRKAETRYAPEQTISWLSRLAWQMKHQSQTIFSLEQMQPGWLMKKWQHRLYYGLITGPICGLFVGLAALGTVLSFPFIVLTTALISGLLFGWASEPETETKSTKTGTPLWIRQCLAHSLENGVWIGVAAGLFVGISSFLYLYLGDFSDWSLGSKIAGALAGGLPNGMCMGVCVGLTVRLWRKIEPVEASSWSWTELRRGISRWVFIGIGFLVEVMVVFPFLLTSHDVSLANFLSFALSSVFQLVLVVLLVSGVTRGLSMRIPDVHQAVTPNQGTWRSARYGVVMALITAGIAAVLTGASDFLAYYWVPLHLGSSIKPLGIDREAVGIMSHLLGVSPTTSQEFWILHALFWGLTDAAIPALAVGLACGGAAFVQHFVLRCLLWCAGCIPFNYARFLDYAAERILLRKVGGGYIFIHRLLLEYFADVQAEAPPSATASPTRGLHKDVQSAGA